MCLFVCLWVVWGVLWRGLASEGPGIFIGFLVVGVFYSDDLGAGVMIGWI